MGMMEPHSEQPVNAASGTHETEDCHDGLRSTTSESSTSSATSSSPTSTTPSGAPPTSSSETCEVPITQPAATPKSKNKRVRRQRAHEQAPHDGCGDEGNTGNTSRRTLTLQLSWCSDDEPLGHADGDSGPVQPATKKAKKVADKDLEGQGLPVNSLQESFKWHFHLVNTLTDLHGQKPIDRLASNLHDATWFSQYSGMGGMEILKRHLEVATDLTGKGCSPGNVFHSVDIDPVCQRVLVCHNPCHVFKDLMQFLQPSVRVGLQRMMAEHEARMKNLLGHHQKLEGTDAKQDAKTQLKSLGEDLLHSLMDYMDTMPDSDFFEKRCLCAKHTSAEEACSIFPEEGSCNTDNEYYMAGTSCTDWSSMGSQTSLAGHTVLPFAVQLQIVKRRRPKVFFHECTRNFKPQILQKYLDGYTVHFKIQKPELRGFPIARTRVYSACIRNDFFLDAKIDDMNVLDRVPRFDGGGLFCAPSEVVDAELEVLAKTKLGARSFVDALPSAFQVRRDQYQEDPQVQEMLSDGSDVIVNLTQNVDFLRYASTNVPCLLTKSYMWSLRLHRPMTWQELFNAQGVPMFQPYLEAAGIGHPPVPGDLGRLAGVKMAGNGFHIACAGSFVGFVLSFLEKKPVTAEPDSN